MFLDRDEAGKLLVKSLKSYSEKKTVVYGITRGGILVCKNVCSSLKFKLSPIIVKKIGTPENSELALGAVTFKKVFYIDKDLVSKLRLSDSEIKRLIDQKYSEVNKLIKTYQISQNILKKQIGIIIDDGIATGATVKVVIKYLKQENIKRIVLAVPVIAREIYDNLKNEVEKIIALKISDDLQSVSQYYQSFPQATDKEVKKVINLFIYLR